MSLQGSNWALLDEKFWVLIRRTSVMYLYLKILPFHEEIRYMYMPILFG